MRVENGQVNAVRRCERTQDVVLKYLQLQEAAQPDANNRLDTGS